VHHYVLHRVRGTALSDIYPATRNSRYKPRMIERPQGRDFRSLLKPGAAVVLPGVSNALAARVVADLGFPAAYITGAGIANTFLGIPDIGLVTLSELAEHVAAIREVFPGPLMVDADTGFGNALNMGRTIKLLERSGANAMQIEDQVFPKRCGHFDGKQVIPAAEMVAKIRAAVDARNDPALVIVARTDAIATDGFKAAIDRAIAYREAGADVTFVEAPQSLDEIAEIPRLLPWPQLINIVLGGRTPELPNARLRELGYAGVLYANVALQSALRGMQEALSVLRRTGQMGEGSKLAVDFTERQRLVGKAEFDALERKYRAD
jgi:2-methylisocitrate lyase-like PEP mutase family enzyme